MTYTNARLQWLDFFRGVAALSVVFYHFHDALGLPRFEAGYLAVDLFFVLSGIVLGLKYTSLIEGGMTFREFAWHRLRRLYPMALVVTALVLAMNAIGMPKGLYISSEPQGWVATLTIIPIPASAGFIESFPPDGAMYTLWAELASNVVWFIALKVGRRPTAVLFVASMAAFIYFAVEAGKFAMGWQAGWVNLLHGLIRALAWFGLGFYVAQFRVKPITPIYVSIAVLIAALTVFQRHHGLTTVPLSFVIVLAGTALLVDLMHRAPQNAALIRVCALLGMLSYPLYLIHVPSDRIALFLVGMGGPQVVTHIAVLMGAGLFATILNEFIVRRLPRDQPFRSRLAKST